MMLARGAAVGAIVGAGWALGRRFLAPLPPADVGVETEHLQRVDALQRAVAAFRDLAAANDSAASNYALLVSQADRVAGHVAGTRPLSSFVFNRACAEMKRTAKALCVAAGVGGREMAVRSREVWLDDFPALERFCDDALFNMSLD